MEFYFLTDDDAKILYQVEGEGSPILFVHGWGGDHISFQQQMKYLSSKFKVITYDHRGHGGSDKPETGYTLPRFAEDLEQLINHLKLDNITLVGWSMGTAVLYEYFRIYGTKKIAKCCLIDYPPKMVSEEGWNYGMPNYTWKDYFTDLTTMSGSLYEYALTMPGRAQLKWDDNILDYLIKRVAHNYAHALCCMWGALGAADHRNVLPEINIPTVIIYGERSTTLTKSRAEYIQSKIPNSKVVCFGDCTHFLVLENPLKLNTVIEELASSGFQGGVLDGEKISW